MDELRERLVSKVRQLPAARLPDLAQWLRALECGGLPPLFKTGSAASDDAQRVLESEGNPSHSKDWPHAPIHRLDENGTYIVTAGTYRKEHYFAGRERLDFLEASLLRIVKEAGWQLEAWAVFLNHYHFVAHATPEARPLRAALTALHSTTAREANRLDGEPERKVWHNYRETKLTYEKSYFARLNYVHQNAVKHCLAAVASQYPWCSAAWFERTASTAQIQTIYSFKTDAVRIVDDFEPI